MGEFFDAGFQNYTVLHVNQDLIPQIREKYPNARILVRMYLQNWFNRNPEDWSRQVADIANRLRPFNVEITWANEQNLDLEGHPQGASPTQPVPPASLYQDINKWNLEMIRRLRQLIPWARLHYPAFANDHSDDKNQGGYVGLEICRPSIELADVMDCHCYWRVDEGPLTLDGGQRFVLTHNFFPDKPIFISECGNFAVNDPRSPDQYITFAQSLYNYDYVEGETFFIWDSDAAPENSQNIIQRSSALRDALRQVSKDPPAVLPPIPSAPPPAPRPQPKPQPVPPEGIDYIVLPGDTLISISKKFGIELIQLMNVNHITDARTLRAGQHLRIPGSPAPVPVPGGPRTEPMPTPPPGNQGPIESEPTPVPEPIPINGGSIYIVRPGDTLSAIAKRFNVTVPALVAANTLTDPNLIRVGQRLIIPKPQMVLTVAGVLAVQEAEKARMGVLGIGEAGTTVTPEEIKAFLQGKRTTYYVTRKGDTIPKIAALFNIDPVILGQINQVGLDGELIPGTRLLIPMK